MPMALTDGANIDVESRVIGVIAPEGVDSFRENTARYQFLRCCIVPLRKPDYGEGRLLDVSQCSGFEKEE
jgi:hypothetical protein